MKIEYDKKSKTITLENIFDNTPEDVKLSEDDIKFINYLNKFNKLCKKSQFSVVMNEIKTEKQALAAAIISLRNHYPDDFDKTFSEEELQEMLNIAENMQDLKIEEILKSAWDNFK